MTSNDRGHQRPGSDPPSVAGLLAAGKCKQAVELAKERHKASPSPQTEADLVAAYLGRIEQFQAKGMAADADTLIGLVQQRFPAYRDRLATLRLRAAADAGRVDELVAPLARPDAPADVRAAIEAVLRQSWLDLPGLARCAALPADHPLRVAAAAVDRAFVAVTTGPVPEADLALPEVSFRSPLAGWKLLVRAIGAFYQNDDDDACRRALDAVPPDAAVHRLVPVLRGMVDGRPTTTTGPAGALASRAVADDAPLRQSLGAVEAAFGSYDPRRLQKAIRTAVQACAAAHPDRVTGLRQRIAAACASREVPPDLWRPALGGTPPADADFWRMLARETEAGGLPIEAALYWQRFLAHAVAEGRFPADGLEAAEVYRRSAALLATAGPEDADDFNDRGDALDLLAPLYAGQPAAVAALAPRSERSLRETAMSPALLFHRAVDCRPDRDTFQAWWAWANGSDPKGKSRDQVAKLWHAKRPGDAEPLLHLATLAEDRNAPTLALNHLSAAEAIDPLNPAVRRARLRLTMAILFRHFRERKAHLVEKDLANLAALPGMGDGDRAAGLAALRCAWLAMGNGEAAAAEPEGVEAVVRQLGPLAGRALLDSVADMAKLPKGRTWAGLPATATPPDPRDVARAEARLIAVATDLGLRVVRPGQWDRSIDTVLKERPCPLSAGELLAIGGAAARRPDPKQAYLASAAGLAAATAAPTAAGRATDARFLLVRAASLVSWSTQARAAQCLRAALELARRAHDGDLMNLALVAIDNHPRARRALAGSRSGEGLSDDLLAEVLKAERAAETFPATETQANRHLVLAELSSPFGFGFFGGGRDPEIDDGSYEDEDDDADDNDEAYDQDGEDDGPGLFDFGPLDLDLDAAAKRLSPDLLRQLQAVIDRLGHFPSPTEMMRLDPALLAALLSAVGGAGAGKRAGPRRKGRR